MQLHPAHFVAIIGGAVAGSEAAINLAQRGVKVAVFEQNTRPYGKIEDGLPKWHVRLQAQEERKIDEKLSHPNVLFVPNTTLGIHLDFLDLVKNWGFSAVLLANGAWQDRPLPVEGIAEFVGRGLVYQNDLVRWFNHYHERDYDGERFDIPDSTIIIGGGLASLDVVKIVMLETVLAALKKMEIHTDILELEHDSIRKVLDRHQLTLSSLGLNGCVLFYRRRAVDMPLAQIPPDASPERIEKIYTVRQKILRNFREKYLFKFQECRAPTGVIAEGRHLAGLRFKKTEIKDGKVRVLHGTEHEVRAPLCISSIGSVPQMIEGLDTRGELYDIRDPNTGQLEQFDHVFALGNVVTGKGNIKASYEHGKQVANHVLDDFLAWRESDYEKLIQVSSENTRSQVDKIAKMLTESNLLSAERVGAIVEKIESCQQRVGYSGSYADWIAEHRLESIDEVIAAQKPSPAPL